MLGGAMWLKPATWRICRLLWGQAFSRHLAKSYSLSLGRVVAQFESRLDVKPISRVHRAKTHISFLTLGFQDATCSCCLLPFWLHILPSLQTGFPLPFP